MKRFLTKNRPQARLLPKATLLPTVILLSGAILLLGIMLLLGACSNAPAPVTETIATVAVKTMKPTPVRSQFHLPEYEKMTLNNGLTLVLMEQHEVPMIDVNITINGGALEDGDKSGLARLCADALMFGTDKLSREELENQLDFVGARVRSFGGREVNGMTASFTTRDSEMMLSLINDLLRTPSFDAEEFTKHKRRYLARLEQQKESPRNVIGSYYNSLVFGDHPYANNTRGTTVSVGNIEVADLKAYHQRCYQPGNVTICVAGDFDSQQLKRQLRNLYGSWMGSNVIAHDITTPAPLTSSRVLLVNKEDAKETTFYIGGLGVPMSNPDYVGIQVVNTILGGRFTSWLNDELRVNAGLTYGARSRFGRYSAGGTFLITTYTGTATTEQAVDLALETYNRLWVKGIDKATLESAKSYVKGQFPPRYETSSQLAGVLGDIYASGFDESNINNFEKQVDELDSSKVKQIINDYFPRENLQFVMIGKASEIRELAARYGEVVEVEISQDGFDF